MPKIGSGTYLTVETCLSLNLKINGSTNFLSRPVLLSQLFEKKTKSPQSKTILCVYFPIFLPELNGSTNFLS
ncbi:hypothetical protein CKN94_00330 [Carnobacterium maltaromaticum]|nr:hypothetical protein CKN94_00330 [Carnobacterium maltaromaticum]TFJ79771.1 hypothetical protein CKN97_00330 [Carnobacterium maltaromaticum]